MLLFPDVIVAALATWRISHMLLYENGPFQLLRKARILAGVTYYDGDSGEVSSSRYEITTCIWCLSVWVGMAVGALWLLVPVWAFWIVLPYALSAVAIGVHKATGAIK